MRYLFFIFGECHYNDDDRYYLGFKQKYEPTIRINIVHKNEISLKLNIVWALFIVGSIKNNYIVYTSEIA